MSFTFDTTITLSLVATIAIAFVGWVRMHNSAVSRRIDVCGERLDRHETRINSTEQALQNLPNKEDLHGLSLSMSEIRGDMKEVRAAMQGQAQILTRVETVVSRQEDHLMRKQG